MDERLREGEGGGRREGGSGTDLDEAVVEVEAEEAGGERGVGGDLRPGDAADDGVHAGAALLVEVVGQARVGLEEPRPRGRH